jgi:uncharacterized repeat protein (TIGR03833 family)
MDGRYRKNIKPGMYVNIILKADQPTGKKTPGIVERILTPTTFHPHGIKVKLVDGQVGRIIEILD